MSSPKLRHSPYAIFKDSQTPPGLYARQKWLNQGETETYRADFAATVAKLRYADMDTGSREERILVKLHRLFGLHLTVRNADRSIEIALSEVIGESEHSTRRAGGLRLPPQRGLKFKVESLAFALRTKSLFF